MGLPLISSPSHTSTGLMTSVTPSWRTMSRYLILWLPPPKVKSLPSIIGSRSLEVRTHLLDLPCWSQCFDSQLLASQSTKITELTYERTRMVIPPQRSSAQKPFYSLASLGMTLLLSAEHGVFLNSSQHWMVVLR